MKPVHMVVLLAGLLGPAGCKKATVGLPCAVPNVGELVQFCRILCNEGDISRCNGYPSDDDCELECLALHPSRLLCLNDEGICSAQGCDCGAVDKCFGEPQRTVTWRGLECPAGLCIAVQEQTSTGNALCTAECDSDSDCRAEGGNCADADGNEEPFVCVKPLEVNVPLFTDADCNPERENCDTQYCGVKLCVCRAFAEASDLICPDGRARQPAGCPNEGCPGSDEE